MDRLLGRLSRRTSSGRYIAEVDGLRFVAILLVLLFHIGVVVDLAHGSGSLVGTFGQGPAPSNRGALFSVIGNGGVGVYLFFIVSGFVLALPFVSARFGGGTSVDLRRYFLRRVTRIEPPYIVVMSLLFVALAIVGTPATGHYLAGLAYVHQFVYGYANPLDAVTWSLEVEIQFYLLAPLLAVILSSRNVRARRLLLLLVAVAATAYRQIVAQADPFQATFVLQYLPFFLAGWLLADLFITEWREGSSGHRAWDLVSLVGWPVLFAGLDRWPSVFLSLAVPWIGLALCCAAFRGPVTRQILRNRWLSTIGGMCYSIYLVHYPVFVVLGRAIGALRTGSVVLDVLVYAILLVPVALLAAVCLFVVVERPCMDPAWATRLWDRWQRRPPQVVG